MLKESLMNFLKAVINFDWYYHYSDDSSVLRNGDLAYEAIKKTRGESPQHEAIYQYVLKLNKLVKDIPSDITGMRVYIEMAKIKADVIFSLADDLVRQVATEEAEKNYHFRERKLLEEKVDLITQFGDEKVKLYSLISRWSPRLPKSAEGIYCYRSINQIALSAAVEEKMELLSELFDRITETPKCVPYDPEFMWLLNLQNYIPGFHFIKGSQVYRHDKRDIPMYINNRFTMDFKINTPGARCLKDYLRTKDKT